MAPVLVKVPRANNNDDLAIVVEVSVIEGQEVRAGDALFELETTKARIDVVAEKAGFIQHIGAVAGQTLKVGDLLCVIAPSRDPVPAVASVAPGSTVVLTDEAKRIAASLGVEPSEFPSDRPVTGKMVLELARKSARAPALPENLETKENHLVVYGGGRHGRILLEILAHQSIYEVLGIIDDGLPTGTLLRGTRVLGPGTVLQELRARGIQLAVNGIGWGGSGSARREISELLRRHGFTLPPLVHSSAFVDGTVKLGDGAQVLGQAYVGNDSVVGRDVIVSSGSVISHDCIVGEGSHMAPGSLLAGSVRIGAGCQVGMGAALNAGITVGDGVQIGNGAIIHSDLSAGAIVRTDASSVTNKIIG